MGRAPHSPAYPRRSAGASGRRLVRHERLFLRPSGPSGRVNGLSGRKVARLPRKAPLNRRRKLGEVRTESRTAGATRDWRSRRSDKRARARRYGRIRRETSPQHRAGERLDVGARDLGDSARAHGRRDVDALHRLAVLPVREPRALDRDALPQTLGGLVDGDDLHHRLAGRRVASSAWIRRNAWSACARVSPSEPPFVRFGPSRRFSRRPSGVRQRP
jgi:hypothetical protein